MEHHVICPWRLGPLLASPARKALVDPFRVVRPYLSAGMRAMDIGAGMGFFTIPMATLVGDEGRVIAVDLQPEMIAGLEKRAGGKGCANITTHVCEPASLNVREWDGAVDFALLFWVLHEVPDAKRTIGEIRQALAPNGKLLFAEPVLVSRERFRQSVDLIEQTGFTLADRPKISISRAAVFMKD